MSLGERVDCLTRIVRELVPVLDLALQSSNPDWLESCPTLKSAMMDEKEDERHNFNGERTGLHFDAECFDSDLFETIAPSEPQESIISSAKNDIVTSAGSTSSPGSSLAFREAKTSSPVKATVSNSREPALQLQARAEKDLQNHQNRPQSVSRSIKEPGKFESGEKNFDDLPELYTSNGLQVSSWIEEFSRVFFRERDWEKSKRFLHQISYLLPEAANWPVIHQKQLIKLNFEIVVRIFNDYCPEVLECYLQLKPWLNSFPLESMPESVISEVGSDVILQICSWSSFTLEESLVKMMKIAALLVHEKKKNPDALSIVNLLESKLPREEFLQLLMKPCYTGISCKELSLLGIAIFMKAAPLVIELVRLGSDPNETVEVHTSGLQPRRLCGYESATTFGDQAVVEALFDATREHHFKPNKKMLSACIEIAETSGYLGIVSFLSDVSRTLAIEDEKKVVEPVIPAPSFLDSSSAPLLKCKFSGFLMKKTSFFRRQKRFFVLDCETKTLQYFVRDPAVEYCEMRGRMDLSSATIRLHPEENRIDIRLPNNCPSTTGRVHYELYGVDEQSWMYWKKAFHFCPALRVLSYGFDEEEEEEFFPPA